ncbi:MAG TPA: AmmeMemoRadiSam system radical SAM enzyme [Lentisphaeria bacterium]|nr:MAG: AmmeMemoRadiSam system radical SAM enzyme [Lentisphaerae bacterium GWF2_38_69]HBM16582.1 AmmeMemoRadiSam system radical SAM enzyme [Lentisphaeria bacterium]
MADLAFEKARFWEKKGQDSIICGLCPRNCIIRESKIGFCGVRKNINGILYSLVYGYPAALHVDPIEKKPLAMFMPETYTFSIGTFGCNLDCSFCQNFTLSKNFPEINTAVTERISSSQIISKAIYAKCRSIAFTYNEPTVWAEYAIDIATEAKKNNLPIVLVSNGFITQKAIEEFYPLIDAANIDMKGFSENFYETMCKGSLKHVLNSIKYLYQLKKHIELTNLVIPEKNDSEEMIKAFLDWVERELDKSIPLHFSAYFPTYKYLESQPTPKETLFKIREYAWKRNFTNVFIGNIR